MQWNRESLTPGPQPTYGPWAIQNWAAEVVGEHHTHIPTCANSGRAHAHALACHLCRTIPSLPPLPPVRKVKKVGELCNGRMLVTIMGNDHPQKVLFKLPFMGSQSARFHCPLKLATLSSNRVMCTTQNHKLLYQFNKINKKNLLIHFNFSQLKLVDPQLVHR